jgi:hypothetical protein
VARRRPRLWLAQRLPDVALLDFHLRGGERSDGLIAQLRQQGVLLSCFPGHLNFPHRHRWLARRSLRSRSAKRSLLLTWARLLPEPEVTRGDDNGASAKGKLLKFCRRQLSVAHRILELAMAKVRL